jgi:hypothetical protein
MGTVQATFAGEQWGAVMVTVIDFTGSCITGNDVTRTEMKGR